MERKISQNSDHTRRYHVKYKCYYEITRIIKINIITSIQAKRLVLPCLVVATKNNPFSCREAYTFSGAPVEKVSGSSPRRRSSK